MRICCHPYHLSSCVDIYTILTLAEIETERTEKTVDFSSPCGRLSTVE